MVVAAVQLGSSRDESIMPLLRTLHFLLAHFSVALRARHVPGVENGIADAISRDRPSELMESVSLQLQPAPDPLPQPL